MSPEEVPADLVEKALRVGLLPGALAAEHALAEAEYREVLAAVLPDYGARLLEEFHENYDFFFNTRGEPVSAVASSDFTTEIARLTEGNES